MTSRLRRVSDGLVQVAGCKGPVAAAQQRRRRDARSRHRASGDLVGVLLNADFLPVGKFGLLDVEVPSGPVVACRVGAERGLRPGQR
jgi:hypothetical protein